MAISTFIGGSIAMQGDAPSYRSSAGVGQTQPARFMEGIQPDGC